MSLIYQWIFFLHAHPPPTNQLLPLYTNKQKNTCSLVSSITEHFQANHNKFFRGRSVSSDHTDTNSETEHSERSPLVSAKLDSLARFIFSRTLLNQNGEASGSSNSKECGSPTRLIKVLFVSFLFCFVFVCVLDFSCPLRWEMWCLMFVRGKTLYKPFLA